MYLFEMVHMANVDDTVLHRVNNRHRNLDLLHQILTVDGIQTSSQDMDPVLWSDWGHFELFHDLLFAHLLGM